MADLLPMLVVLAIVGAGLMAGLLFAFSLVVMRALQQLPAEQGMLAMQRINVLIVRPLFLLVFLGTAVLCLVILAASVPGAFVDRRATWFAIGAAAYLIGPVGVTIVFNVPLNNRLAAVLPGDAGRDWPPYVDAWLRWNHVRTVLGCVTIAALSLGLAQA